MSVCVCVSHAGLKTMRAPIADTLRPGDGHQLKEGPKKNGSGRGNWGTYKDDPQ
jgi:hypothetical protein